MVVATTVTGDLDQVRDEMSDFARRFGLVAPDGRVAAGRAPTVGSGGGR
jgi:hypothetical protein